MKKSEIRNLIRELIVEVGESNIEPIPYKQIKSGLYEFSIEINNLPTEVVVKFDNLDKYKYEKQGLVPDIYKDSTKTFTVLFKVGGQLEEFLKTDSNIWFKIFNTVIHIIKDFVAKINPDVIIFLPVEKFSIGKKKTNIYSLYLKKQINQFPQYAYEEHDIYTIIYKKY